MACLKPCPPAGPCDCAPQHESAAHLAQYETKVIQAHTPASKQPEAKDEDHPSEVDSEEE